MFLKPRRHEHAEASPGMQLLRSPSHNVSRTLSSSESKLILIFRLSRLAIRLYYNGAIATLKYYSTFTTKGMWH